MFTVEIRIFISVLHLLKRCIHRALFCCELLWRQIQLNFMCKRPFTIFLSFFFYSNSLFPATLMSWWIAPGWLACSGFTVYSQHLTLMLETQLYRKNCGINNNNTANIHKKIEKNCRLFLQSPANPDLLYIIFFCHTQLTVTLLLALIFGSKVNIIKLSKGDIFIAHGFPLRIFRVFASVVSDSCVQMPRSNCAVVLKLFDKEFSHICSNFQWK